MKWGKVGYRTAPHPFMGLRTMFSGTLFATIDEKGRLAIPARHRARLRDDSCASLMIVYTPEGLRLYPCKEFERVVREIIPSIANINQRRAMMSHFVGSAEELELDGQGRVMIPAKFRAALTSNVALIGQWDFIKLMSAVDLEASQAQSFKDYCDGFAAHLP